MGIFMNKIQLTNLLCIAVASKTELSELTDMKWHRISFVEGVHMQYIHMYISMPWFYNTWAEYDAKLLEMVHVPRGIGYHGRAPNGPTLTEVTRL